MTGHASTKRSSSKVNRKERKDKSKANLCYITGTTCQCDGYNTQ